MSAIGTIAKLALPVGIPVLLALLWLDHARETTLPTPTGPFSVGRITDVWTDELQPGPQRKLLVWIWYPTAPRLPSTKADDYLPAPWRAAVEQQRGIFISQLLTRDLSRVRAHGIRNAELSPQHPSYPVVLMRAGLAALVANYTSLAEELASRGYIVVGFDAPYRSSVAVFPDGRVITRAPEENADLVSGSEQEQLLNELVRDWNADMGFALDQLEKLNRSGPSARFPLRLDMERVGVFGHSLGGATALQFCNDDSRCRAGIDVDGAPRGSVIREGVTQPFMFLVSDHRSEPDAETRPVLANIRSIYDRLPGDRRWWLMIRGANHYGFSDDGAILKTPLLMRALRTAGIVHLSGLRQIAVTAHYITTFFDVYLKSEPASELTNRAQFPEVEYVH